MSLTKFSEDVENIQALSDKPNEVEGLTADELKAKWDKAGEDIKEYINDTLTDEVDTELGALDTRVTTAEGDIIALNKEVARVVTTAAQNTITIPDLDINAHGKIYEFFINAANANFNDIIYCTVNNVTTGYSGGAALLGSTYNGTYTGDNPYCGWCQQNVFNIVRGTITLFNNRYNLISQSLLFNSVASAANSNSITNITSLTFKLANNQNFAIGTEIIICKK